MARCAATTLADLLLGRAGYVDRQVVVHEDRLGEKMAPAFSKRGYEVERDLLMMHRRLRAHSFA